MTEHSTAFCQEAESTQNRTWNQSELFRATTNQKICNCITNDELALLRELLEEGVMINRQEATGITPLYWAFLENNLPAFEILLEYGADPHRSLQQTIYAEAKGSEQSMHLAAGNSVVHEVCRRPNGRKGFLPIVMRYISQPDQTTSDGMTLLHVYARCFGPFNQINPWDIASMQIMEADIDLRDPSGLTPCRIAFRYSIPAQTLGMRNCKAFLKMGADRTLASNDGTILEDDVRREERLPYLGRETEEEFHDFLEQLGDPDFDFTLDVPSPKNQNTTFAPVPSVEVRAFPTASLNDAALAISYGKPFELNNPVDINTPGKHGLSLLFWAYLHDNYAAFKELLKSSADPDCKLDEILSFKAFGAANLIPLAGETVLLASAWNPQTTQYIELAIEYTEAPNAADLHGRNILHRFLYYPRPEQTHLLQKIIKTGINLDAKTLAGMTACHLAVRHNPRFIPVLVDAGADPHIRNRLGESTLQLLSQVDHPTEEHQRVLEWLVERSARE